MSKEQSQTKNQLGVTIGAIGLVAAIFCLAALLAKLLDGDFDTPQLKVGDCVLQYKNNRKRLERWEKRLPEHVIRVEEIGEERYRTTTFYVSNVFQKNISSFSGSDRIQFLDEEQKIDCNAGISEIWNAQ